MPNQQNPSKSYKVAKWINQIHGTNKIHTQNRSIKQDQRSERAN